MKNANWVWAGSLFFGLVAGGCGDSNHSDPDNREDLSQRTPAELCQQKCALQVAPNCPNAPPDYERSCVLICQAKYDKFPNCAAAAHALDACGIQRVSYACEQGTISATPTGACAAEGLACASCTGSFLDCL